MQPQQKDLEFLIRQKPAFKSGFRSPHSHVGASTYLLVLLVLLGLEESPQDTLWLCGLTLSTGAVLKPLEQRPRYLKF